MTFFIEIPEHLLENFEHTWLPDGDNTWFYPAIIDLKNNLYAGWWYASESIVEPAHYHGGIAQGRLLLGELRLLNKLGQCLKVMHPGDEFLLPPKVVHGAELVVGDDGFLMFGTILGETFYLESEENEDAFTYYRRLKAFNFDFKNTALVK